MPRGALLATAIVFALAGCGGGDGDTAAPTTAPTTTTAAVHAEPVLASFSGNAGSEVFWADGLTLEPVDGRSLDVPFFYSVAELSPDGTQLALGGNERSMIQIVDLEEMREVRTIDAGLGEWVEHLQWVAPDLLLASFSGLPTEAAAIDPLSGKVLHAEELEGVVLGSEPAGGAIAFLLAPERTIGPAAVALFDGRSLRSVKLKEIAAGWEEEGESEEDYRSRQSIPGFAVDPSGQRALVVPAGNRVAEVDLATMEAGYRDLSQPVSLLGRLRNWLEPAAEAKMIDGPSRAAVWLPSGLVAVSGVDYSTDGDNVDLDFAGLSLIDPASWSVNRVSDEPGWVTYRDGALLGSAWKEGSDHQAVHVFGADGALRFSVEREGADLSQVSGGYLYATSYDGTRFEIIDLATGETVAQAEPRRETGLVFLG